MEAEAEAEAENYSPALTATPVPEHQQPAAAVCTRGKMEGYGREAKGESGCAAGASLLLRTPQGYAFCWFCGRIQKEKGLPVWLTDSPSEGTCGNSQNNISPEKREFPPAQGCYLSGS